MQQLVYPDLETKADVGECLNLVWRSWGSPPGRGFRYARQAWDGQDHRVHGEYPPLGVTVPIWHDYEATIGGIKRNWGHVSNRLADGRVQSSPYPDRGDGYLIYNSVAEMEAHMGLGAYLGWSASLDDLLILDTTIPAPGEEEDDTMPKPIAVRHRNDVLIFDMPTGVEHRFTSGSASYRRTVAQTYGAVVLGPDVTEISEDHFKKIGAELAATRATA